MTWTETTDLDQIYQELRADPHWLLYQFDPFKDQCQLLRVDETAYKTSLFLDNRLNAETPRSVILKLSALLQQCAADTNAPRPLNYLFHIGHCGSTLLSQLLGNQQDTLALREPMALLALAYVKRQLETDNFPVNAESYPLLEKFIILLLSRTFNKSQRVLVKPTSICCNIAHDLMDYHPDCKAALLYIDLESYLATMLRFDERRTETASYAHDMLSDYRTLGGSAEIDLDELSIAQKSALNWLVQMAWLTRLNTSRPHDTRMVNFDGFLAAPADTLQFICGFAGIDSTVDTLRESIDSQLMHSYSKKPMFKYNGNIRQSELQKSRQEHTAEITPALAWAKSICATLPDAECLTRYQERG